MLISKYFLDISFQNNIKRYYSSTTNHFMSTSTPTRDLRTERIQQERKQWRKDHPFGFYAKPEKKPNGTLDLHNWNAGVPGKPGTIWENATYPLTINFSEEYPAKPPKIKFPPNFYHPNVYPSGTICLSILNEEQDWRPAISLKQLLLGIQELLNTPNPSSPAQEPAWRMLQKDPVMYEKKIRAQAALYFDKK